MKILHKTPWKSRRIRIEEKRCQEYFHESYREWNEKKQRPLEEDWTTYVQTSPQFNLGEITHL